MKCKSQENAVFIAIHPTTYRSGGFLAHGVVKKNHGRQCQQTETGKRCRNHVEKIQKAFGKGTAHR